MSIRIYSPRLNETLFAQQEVRMGEVSVQLQLENTVDRELMRRGLIAEDHVRKLETFAVVNTEVLMLMLPQDQAEALGLNVTEGAAADPVTATVCQRSATVNCRVGIGSTQAVLGRLPLMILDLHLNEAQRTLSPRPESPLLPLYRI